MRRWGGWRPTGRADKVLGPGCCLRKIALGEATDFVGSGLDPGSGVGAGAELFVFEGGRGSMTALAQGGKTSMAVTR
jgi:hypothetical protein